jgi:hypothetical protein
MSNLTTALLVILSINAMMFLGQTAVNEWGSTTVFYDEVSGTCVKSNPTDSLPDTGQSIDPDTGLGYTDDFGAGSSYLKSDKGSCTASIMTAPANFLKYMGLPTAFSWAIMVLWYGLTVFLFVSWLLGRDA